MEIRYREGVGILKHTILIGGVEKEISQELADALLKSEYIRLQICKSKDLSLADIFGILDKNLKQSHELKFIDFRLGDDVSTGDVLFAPSVGELRITSIEPQFHEGAPYALRAYVNYSPQTVIFSEE